MWKTKEVFAMTLGEALKNFRLKNDILQKQMAYILKISREYYCKIENDKVFPSPKLLSKICEITGIKIEFNYRKTGGNHTRITFHF